MSMVDMKFTVQNFVSKDKSCPRNYDQYKMSMIGLKVTVLVFPKINPVNEENCRASKLKRLK